MKRALLKDSLKEIRKSFKRFLSILLMSLLGVGFFCGLRAASPDMKATIDKYYDDANFYDIQILSTLGLTDDDVTSIENVDGIEKAYPSFSKDVKLVENNLEYVLNVSELNNEVNTVKLVEGELPKNANECLVESSLLLKLDKKIGDKIKIEEVLSDDEENSFINNELTVTGTIESPLYISRERGTSTLGSGKINYYMYVPKENIKSDIYTLICLKVANAKELNTTSEEYKNIVESAKERIEEIEDTQKQKRYDSLINEANQKLDDAQNELDTQKADAEAKIKEAEDEIKQNEEKLNNAQKELNTNRNKANSEFENAKNQINTAKTQLDNSKAELEQKKQEAEEQFKEAEEQKQKLQTQLDSLNSGISEINSRYNEILNIIDTQGKFMSEEQMLELKSQLAYIIGSTNELTNNKSKLEEAIRSIDNQVSSGRAELENAEKQIQTGYSEIEKNQQTLNEKITETNKKLEDAQKEINEGKEKLEEGKKTLEDNKAEFDEKIKDAEGKLIDAREKVADIEKPEWYIWDRNNNQGYASYVNDSDNMSKIANVFPVVFFVIAALISLTSMTRMVEEQRGLIGTFKALGYSNLSISMKYVIYATLATVIGAVIGMNIGFQLLPRIVISLYQMMYPYVTNAVIEFNIYYACIGLGLISICIIGATIYAVQKELFSTPAQLMRPKAPKAGKRVLLEKIPFIWKHLNFTQKVTFRNMFRYKKRFIMTIVGISGCTALILVGFGIKDSISQIMHFQYGEVYQYNALVSLKSNLKSAEIESIKKELVDMDEISSVTETYIGSATVIKGDKEKDVQIVVPNDSKELTTAITLKDRKTREKLNLNDNSIFITDKVAELLGIKVGDKIELEDSKHNKVSVIVGKIVEQYLEHYIYMSKELYENTFSKEYQTNILYANYANTNIAEDKLTAKILEDNKVSTVIGTTKMIASADDMLQSLNSIVYILIISAGLLAFVVLYNLANININERIRELATIKVLGFYDKEVFDYVSREVVFLTIIGIFLGLIGGFFLTNFIISTCEIEMLRFPKTIGVMSYIYSALITIVFTIIVNIATYFVLKKIDMIESLKSVE